MSAVHRSLNLTEGGPLFPSFFGCKLASHPGERQSPVCSPALFFFSLFLLSLPSRASLGVHGWVWTCLGWSGLSASTQREASFTCLSSLARSLVAAPVRRRGLTFCRLCPTAVELLTWELPLLLPLLLPFAIGTYIDNRSLDLFLLRSRLVSE